MRGGLRALAQRRQGQWAAVKTWSFTTESDGKGISPRKRPSRCCRSASISASPRSSTGTSAFTPSPANACPPTKADAACSALFSQMMRGASKGRLGSAAHLGLLRRQRHRRYPRVDGRSYAAGRSAPIGASDSLK